MQRDSSGSSRRCSRPTRHSLKPAERALECQRLKLAEEEIAATAERKRNLAERVPDRAEWESGRRALRERAELVVSPGTHAGPYGAAMRISGAMFSAYSESSV
jgi:hypothetical protein